MEKWNKSNDEERLGRWRPWPKMAHGCPMHISWHLPILPIPLHLPIRHSRPKNGPGQWRSYVIFVTAALVFL